MDCSNESGKVVRNLEVKWSDKLGDYQYTLFILKEYDNGERTLHSTASGDNFWAERIAAHYSLTVPEVQ